MRRLLLVALLAAASLPGAAGGLTPALQPEIRAARGGPCIAEPATMRREHMTRLAHQRDATVRAGVRGKPASLKACVECHASADTGSVAAAAGDFCVSCHAYAAVTIDCFECHASRPPARVAAGARR